MGKRAGPRGREIRIALHDGGWDGDERVSGVLVRPGNAVALLVLAHGAGAGMRHAFMEATSAELAGRGIATLRFNFPYMEIAGAAAVAAGVAVRRRPPDRAPRLIASVRAAVIAARTNAGDLPLFAGGKSMGGRMTSLAASEAPLVGVRGIVFFGFPLHPAGRPSSQRGEHLADVDPAMLFLQGTRDKLADLERLEPICRNLGSKAALHIVEGADHSFHVLKRSGRSDSDVTTELGESVEEFCRRRL
jgi:predicted alpha/beta-hydrolase family hydrolase